jgi:hypothetical protein
MSSVAVGFDAGASCARTVVEIAAEFSEQRR